MGIEAGPAVRNNGCKRLAACADPIRSIAPTLATASVVTFGVWVKLEVVEIFQMDDDMSVYVFRQEVAGYPITTFGYQVFAIGHFRLEPNFDRLQWRSQ